MIKKPWSGLMKVLEVKHVRGGKVIWEAKNILNMFHLLGEQKILQYVFAGVAVPDTFYVGLDARATLAEADTMSSLASEPTFGGYTRQAVGSNVFTVEFVSGVYRATSPVVTFSAGSSSSWGPMKNIFLTDKADNTGVLFATASLGQDVIVAHGDSVLMRMGLALRDGTNC